MTAVRGMAALKQNNDDLPELLAQPKKSWSPGKAGRSGGFWGQGRSQAGLLGVVFFHGPLQRFRGPRVGNRRCMLGGIWLRPGPQFYQRKPGADPIIGLRARSSPA